DPRQSAYGEAIVARDSVARPCLAAEVSEEIEGRYAACVEPAGECSECKLVETASLHADSLTEGGKRTRQAACEPERPRREEALGIVDVSDELLDAPLLRLVAISGARFGDRLQQSHGVMPLLVERREDVAVGNGVDVLEVVLGGFIGRRACAEVVHDVSISAHHQSSIRTSDGDFSFCNRAATASAFRITRRMFDPAMPRNWSSV